MDKDSKINKESKKKNKAKGSLTSEMKEDWTIFGITQENLTHDQLAQIVEEAIQNVDKINNNDVKEITRFAQPSVVMKDVFGLLMIFFEHKDDWSEVVKFIKLSGSQLQNMLRNYDKESMSFAILKKAKKFFEKYPNVELISKMSKVTASIYLVLKALYFYKIVSHFVSLNEQNEDDNTDQKIEVTKNEEINEYAESGTLPPTIDQVSPVINAARQALNCVDKNNLIELISLKKAPKIIDIVIKCTLHILGSKTESDKNNKWRAYRSSKMLIEEISHLDFNLITDADVEYVDKVIRDNKLTYESVKAASLAASNLYQWVINVMNYRRLTNEIRREVGFGWNPEWEALVNGKGSTAEPVEEEKKVERESDEESNEITTSLKQSLNSSTKKKKVEEEEDWTTFGVVADNIDRNAITELLQKAENSINCLTLNDITEIRKMGVPPQTMKEGFDAIFHLLGAKSKKQKEAARVDVSADIINKLMYFDANHISFSDMKYLQKYFESYPDPDKISKTSAAASCFWHWLNGVYRKRLFVEFTGLEARFKRNPTWESLNFTKSEEEATGERFTQWMATTQEYIDQIQPQDITEMKSCKNPPDHHIKVLKAIGPLFGARTEEQLQTYANEGWKVPSFLEDLRNARIDQLTLKDCLNGQILLNDLSRDIVIESSRAGAELYSFICSFIELRISVALFGKGTGYIIEETQSESEEETKGTAS